ncbi:hypothetical protein G4B88_013432 [Cannabis sativa]|uniref:EF-hand domain-containing protein n=1 Tax=Cannabis sativa TaxID=3483 RepID=A0A7J6HLZ0_CANSA|nr:hypothetical protein G4B88_013432 [Cannabis sativa]
MGFNFKVLTHPYDDKQLKGIFERYDANGDGRLSKEELKNAFKSFGCFAPGWRAFRARHFADKNGDGFVDKGELDYLAFSPLLSDRDGVNSASHENTRVLGRRFDVVTNCRDLISILKTLRVEVPQFDGSEMDELVYKINKFFDLHCVDSAIDQTFSGCFPLRWGTIYMVSMDGNRVEDL